MKKLVVFMVLALFVLTACGGGNPVLGEWEFADLSSFLGETEELAGMEDFVAFDGSMEFKEDDTFAINMNIDMDFKALMESMGMGEVEMETEHMIVSVIADGDYSVDGDVLTFEIVDVTSEYEPKELCMTFMGQEQCLTEEEMAEQYDPEDFDLENEFNSTNFQVEGDVLTMWDDDCSGPDADCALVLAKKQIRKD